MNKKYTKEDLIQYIQRFYILNNRVPKLSDMKNGYPSECAFVSHFGTWNNALKASGFEINKLWNKRSDSDICVSCGNTESTRWYYIENGLICNKCYKSDRLYFYGKTDPESCTGIGVITEHVVCKVLGDCIKCNTIDNFCAPCDLISEKYGAINVKSSIVHFSNKLSFSTAWSFRLNRYNHTFNSDTYICLGFNENRLKILRVWIIPKESDLINKSGIHITNSERGLQRASKYEVDSTPYNEVYQNLDITTLPEFRNINQNNASTNVSKDEMVYGEI